MWEKKQKSRLVGLLVHQANDEGWEKQRLETPKWAQEDMCHLQDVERLKNSPFFFYKPKPHLGRKHFIPSSASLVQVRLLCLQKRVFLCSFQCHGGIVQLLPWGRWYNSPQRWLQFTGNLWLEISPSLYWMVLLKMCSPKSALHQEPGGNSPTTTALGRVRNRVRPWGPSLEFKFDLLEVNKITALPSLQRIIYFSGKESMFLESVQASFRMKGSVCNNQVFTFWLAKLYKEFQFWITKQRNCTSPRWDLNSFQKTLREEKNTGPHVFSYVSWVHLFQTSDMQFKFPIVLGNHVQFRNHSPQLSLPTSQINPETRALADILHFQPCRALLYVCHTYLGWVFLAPCNPFRCIS